MTSSAPLAVLPERSFKRPGCDTRCTAIRAMIPGVFGRSELLLHDPDAHEDYGSWQSAVMAPRAHTVITGTLAVNLSSLDVSVDGEPVHLTATELRLLIVLARRIGQGVPYADILREVWHLSNPDTTHLVTVFLKRLRDKLQDAGGVISTIVGIGLRMENVPAGERVPRVRGTRKRMGRWATLTNVCLLCASDSRPHWAHGVCNGCRRAYQRAQERAGR